MIRKKYIRDSENNLYIVDFYTAIDNDQITYTVKSKWGYSTHTTKVYYKDYKTLDDYMGNTPAGYYTLVPIGDSLKRVYIFD